MNGATTPRAQTDTVRRATDSDIEILVEMRIAMQAEMGAIDGPPSPEHLAATRRYFERAIPSGQFVAFVAESGGCVVATSGAVLYEAPPQPGNADGVEIYIMNMYTVPSERGRGLGRALVDRIVEYAREVDARRLWLRASDQGRSMYASAGFESRDNYMQMKLPPQPWE